MANLVTLAIENAIVHDIPGHRAGQEGPGPTLSEAESPLDDELKNYLRERVIDSLGNHSLAVEFDPAVQSVAHGEITTELQPGATGLVAMSQKLATHLYAIQTGTNPAGLLIVFRGTLRGRPCIGVLKLEREEALRLNPSDVNGKKTFKLSHLRDLVLNKGTRVFKTGLFWILRSNVVGDVRDEQLGYGPGRDVAHFFLKNFLGCKLKEEPDITTKNFYDTVEAFVRAEIPDAEDKATYTIAVQAEMGSTSANVDTRRFIRQHLKVEHRDALERRLADASVPRTFVKDVERIRPRLRRIQMDSEENITLIAPPDAFEELVTREQRDDGKTHVEYDATVKDVRPKS